MKKSILKSVVSVFAAAAMVITSTNLVFAENDYLYKIDSVYRSEDGLETNKEVSGFTYKGIALSKLTDTVNANASFITASYDSSTRMKDVVIKPVSELGSTPVMPTVAGDVVKSFVFDMTNLAPLAEAYVHGTTPEKTVRKLDFESVGDYKAIRPFYKETEASATITPNSYSAIGGISTYGVVCKRRNANISYEKVSDGSNNALKIERTAFLNSDGNSYYYDESRNMWISAGNYNDAATHQNHFTLKLDKETNNVKVKLRFKFAGSDNSSQTQCITIIMGTREINIYRDQGGAGKITARNVEVEKGTWSWTDMKADEWYTFTGEITSDKCTCSVAGEFESGYAVKEGWNWAKAESCDYVQIGSKSDTDVISKDLQPVKTLTSVWYVDDIVVEY